MKDILNYKQLKLKKVMARRFFNGYVSSVEKKKNNLSKQTNKTDILNKQKF